MNLYYFYVTQKQRKENKNSLIVRDLEVPTVLLGVLLVEVGLGLRGVVLGVLEPGVDAALDLGRGLLLILAGSRRFLLLFWVLELRNGPEKKRTNFFALIKMLIGVISRLSVPVVCIELVGPLPSPRSPEEVSVQGTVGLSSIWKEIVKVMPLKCTDEKWQDEKSTILRWVPIRERG